MNLKNISIMTIAVNPFIINLDMHCSEQLFCVLRLWESVVPYEFENTSVATMVNSFIINLHIS